MPAPRTNPSTGVMVVAVLLGIGACASNRPEQPASAGAAPVQPMLEDYAPPAPAGVSADLDQLDASLEAYEQQLAQNESRLRAMGVRIASADPADKRESEALAKDDRFAQPPPPRSRDAQGDRARDEAAEVKTKSPAKKATRAPAPSPRPTAPTSAGRAQGGVSQPAEAKPVAAQEPDDDNNRGRCAELCELAQATCELEAKICDLAARHTDDPRYAEVCRRADEDCRVGSEACTLCSP